jgi:hypothetical protein
MTKIIKIYGERNTGTNYLQQLIKLNFNVALLKGVAPQCIFYPGLAVDLMLPTLFKNYPLYDRIEDMYFKLKSSKNLGWKHTLVSSNIMEKIKAHKNDVFFITLTKNPYSWLLSLYNKPYSYASNENLPHFEQFLIEPWKTLERENHPKSFENPIVMWNQKNKSYMQLKSNFHTINIRYEDMLSDPKLIIDCISEQLNITKKHGSFKNLKKSTKEDKKNFNYYQNYYLKEIWKEKLNNKSIVTINKYLDEDVMNYFGYRKIEAS